MDDKTLIKKQNRLFFLLHRLADNMLNRVTTDTKMAKEMAKLSFEVSVENLKRGAT